MKGCTITPAPAIEHIAHIYTRMPVILQPSAYDDWLYSEAQCSDAKALLIGGQIEDQLEFPRVNRSVNSNLYDGLDTKKPIVNSL